MSDTHEFSIPTSKEAESTDHDKEQVAAALREAGAHIDTLIETHGSTETHTPEDPNPADHEPGYRHNVRVSRVTNPDASRSYTVQYTEIVTPSATDPQPDPLFTGQDGPNSNPYDFKNTKIKWQLDPTGQPIESTYLAYADGRPIGEDDGSFPSDFVNEDKITRTHGDLIIENFGDQPFGIADTTTALEAIQDANSTVTAAEQAGTLGVLEPEKVEKKGKLPRVRAFARGVLNRL